MKPKNKADALIEKMCGFSWDNDKNDNIQALKLLKEFLYEFKYVKPNKHIESKGMLLSGYLIRLFLVRNALYKKEYGAACHELYSLAHTYGLYQVRIYVIRKQLIPQLI